MAMAYIAALLQVPVSILASCTINKLQTLAVQRRDKSPKSKLSKGPSCTYQAHETPDSLPSFPTTKYPPPKSV